MNEPLVYLSRAEVANLVGVKSATLSKLPEPDAYVGAARGWLPETIEAWNADRPSGAVGRKTRTRAARLMSRLRRHT